MRCFVRGAALSATSLMVAVAMHAQTDAVAAEVSLPPAGTLMVYVNTQAILPIAPGANDAQLSFQEELTGYEGEMRALGAEIDSLVSAYRRQEALLDQSAKERKQQEILQKQQAAQERRLELEQISEQRRQALLAPILDQVRAVIEEIRAANEYAIVFDVAEAGVVAADPNLDITAAVLQRLGVDPASTATLDPGR